MDGGFSPCSHEDAGAFMVGTYCRDTVVLLVRYMAVRYICWADGRGGTLPFFSALLLRHPLPP